MKYYLLFFQSLIAIYLQAQTFQWAKVEGLWAYDYGYGIAADDSGNFYVAGKYELQANFSGVQLPMQGNHDIYLAKYSPSGSLIWIRTAGGASGDYATTISLDNNYVYIAGEIQGSNDTIWFLASSTTIICKGNNDVFLAKYDHDGNLIWAKQGGWKLNERVSGMTNDANGNVYICGFFTDTTRFGGTQYTGFGARDAFIAKYDSAGNFQWFRKAGGKNRDEGKALKCDSAGNIYMTGMFEDTAFFSSDTAFSPNGFFDIYLAKYQPTGSLEWVKTFGASWDDVGWALAVDDYNRVIVSGEFNAYVNFDSIPLVTSGRGDIFVACFNSSGDIQWAKSAGGNLIDRARGMGTDGKNVYITGQFGSTAYFDSLSLTATDSSDIFIAALDSSGIFKWTAMVGGSPDVFEDLGYESGIAICTDASGYVLATGALLDNGNFGGINLNTWDRTDVFITKLSQGCLNAPTQPGSINGPSSVCIGSSNTFSIPSINGATTYTWTLPSGWTGYSQTNIINLTTDSFPGSISVAAINSCGASSPQQLNISISQPPSPADAGPDQNICSPSSFMAAAAPTVGTGMWSLVSGTATISNPLSPTTTINGIGTGATVLRWKISNSGCTPTFDDVTIVRDAGPTTANAGPDQSVCSSSTSLNANAPTQGTGIWSVVSGTAVLSDSTSPTPSVSNISIGTVILQWTISLSGCTPSVDDVVITRTDMPTDASAGPDQNICSATATLAANAPSSGSGVWSLVSGTAIITDSLSPATSISGIAPGSTTLRWTISTVSCGISTDDVVITRIGEPSTANAGTDQLICSTITNLNANLPASGNGIWSLISGAATIANPTSPTTAITGIGIGSVSLRWTISNSFCTSSEDDVEIVRTPDPSISISAEADSICKGEEMVLYGNGAVNYVWLTDGSTIDSLIANPDTTTNFTIIGTDQNGCKDTVQFLLTVNICLFLTENYRENQIEIFPNPGSGVFSIHGIVIPYEIKIYNSAGILTFKENARDEKLVLELSPGLYFVELSNQKFISRKKLIIQQ